MDLLIILTYSAICVVIFKVFKIPLNKWSVPTAALGGIIIVGSLIFVMNYNHPYSEMSRDYFVTTPIVPIIKGRVIEVPVKGNSKLKKGDVLFKIDPVPFANRVAALKAQLTPAEKTLYRAQTLQDKGVGKQHNVDMAISQVGNIKAQLATAEYELDKTIVRAPTAGYATQVSLRPGMMAVNIPLRPAMVFVHQEKNLHVGWFRQNSLLRLEVGNEAEIAYDSIPGKVFSGVVNLVLPAIAEGQVQASGTLINVPSVQRPGRIPVLIEITDPDFDEYVNKLPGGAFGQSAIYSQHMHHVAIMRKIILRMNAWMNYLFPFH